MTRFLLLAAGLLASGCTVVRAPGLTVVGIGKTVVVECSFQTQSCVYVSTASMSPEASATLSDAAKAAGAVVRAMP